ALQVPGKSEMAERGLERVSRTPEARKVKARAETVSVRFDTPLVMGDFAILSAIAIVCILLSHFGFALLREFRLVGSGAGFSIGLSSRVVADLAVTVSYVLILFSAMQYVLLLLRGDLAWLGWRSKNLFDDLLYGFAVFFGALVVLGGAVALYQAVSYAGNHFFGGSLPQAGRLLSGYVTWEMGKFLNSPPELSTYVAIAFIAPLVEEFFFRGMLYSVLRKSIDLVPSLLISSLLFAAVRLFLFGGGASFFIGVGSALVYEKRMSLFSAVVFHAFCNLLLLCLFQILV
ncbi:MAG: type II CAAX endopeptidase family protein, partial [bacterium]